MALTLSLGSKRSTITLVEGYSEIEIKGDKWMGGAEITVREGMNRGFRNEVTFCLSGQELRELSEMILEAAGWEGVEG